MTQEQRDRNWVIFRLLGWVLFFIMLFLRGCKSEPTKTIPTKGSFKTDTIHHTTLGETKYIKGKPIIQYKNNEINKELAEENYNLQMDYINATDSIEKLKMYIDAIQLKKFSKTFENGNFKANINGIVQGEVKELAMDYEIKKMPIKEVRFRMLLGGGIGINKELNQGIYKLNAGFQNRKGNVLRASYMQIGSQQYGVAEYDFSIFKITK